MRTNRQNAAAKAAALAKSKKTTGAESVDTQNRSKNSDRDSRPTVNQPPDLSKPAKIVPQDSQMAAGDYGQTGVGSWGWNDQQNYIWYNQYPYPNANWGGQPPYYPGSDASDRPPRGPADPSRGPIDPRRPMDQRGQVDPRGAINPPRSLMDPKGLKDPRGLMDPRGPIDPSRGPKDPRGLMDSRGPAEPKGLLDPPKGLLDVGSSD